MKKVEMAATIDRLRQENRQLEEFRVSVAEALQRSKSFSIESLTRHVREDIKWLIKENKELNEKIAMYEVEDDRR